MNGKWLALAGTLLLSCPIGRSLAAGQADSTREAAGTAIARLSPPSSDGERLFDEYCAVCHADGKLYPATMQLRQNGEAQPVLASRKDLDADFVRQAARQGVGSMPGFTPIQLSDVSLDKIAEWLAGHK